MLFLTRSLSLTQKLSSGTGTGTDADADADADAGRYPATNGFDARSRPMVVSGPWPQMTLVSSGRE